MTAMPMCEQQFVRFLQRRLAVIARDRDLDVGRNERALERLDLLAAPAFATEIAFAPGRFAMLSVTAGCFVRLPAADSWRAPRPKKT